MNKKILIIDDEKNIRLTLKSCLDEEGFEIDIAINGEEALKKILSNNYDLVLLDLKMPGIDGMEVLKEIRKKGNEVNVIIMTAYGTVEKAVEAMKLGAIDFLGKPFTPEEIRKIVKSVLIRPSLKEGKLKSFEDFIEYAKICILKKDYEKAITNLIKSIAENMDSAEPHNLLGVLAESKNDILLAIKHYKAALDLEPTYKPAQKNLERISQLRYSKNGIDLGAKENDKEDK